MADPMPSPSVRIVVVDDHRLLAQMLIDHLMEQGFEAMIAHVEDDDLPGTIRRLDPDLVLLDAVFHDDEDAGLHVLQALAGDIVVAMLTGVGDSIRHAEFLDAGAFAVISKSDSFAGVLTQVGDVVNGIDPHGVNCRNDMARALSEHRADQASTCTAVRELTDREHATLQSLVNGHTVDEIAAHRTVATSTIRSQIRAVLQKLGAHSQIEAIATAARSGMRPSR